MWSSNYDEAQWDEIGSAVKPFFSSSYLDSPVLITPRSKFIHSYESVTKLERPVAIADRSPRYKQLTFSQKSAWAVGVLWKRRLLPEILDSDELPLWLHLSPPKKNIGSIKRALAVACNLSFAVNEAWLAWTGQPRSLGGLVGNWISGSLTDNEEYYYSRWLMYDTAIMEVARLYSQQKHRAVKVPFSSKGYLVTNLSIALIYNPDWDVHCRTRLLTWDQLLMVKDCLYTRAQVLTSCRVLCDSYPNLQTLVLRHFKWQEKCLCLYGNSGFEILKSTEALSKAYLSVLAEDEFGEDGPYGRMLEKVRGKERSEGKNDKRPYLCDEYDSILRDCSRIEEVVELFGIQKMTGHPLVDASRGGRVVADVAREPDRTSPKDADEVSWAFKAMILEHYVPTSGWPNLIFTDKTTDLYKLCLKRVRHVPRHSYKLSDWSSCEYPKVFDFDFAPNYLELMDDKAISQYRSNIEANWNPDIPMKSHRRLLMELISREEISAREIVYRVMRREIPYDWLIICLYPKEKELKIVPRMFSMLVFEMRLFFALTESNIAQGPFKFLPEQTMTDSRKDTMSRFLSLTEPRKTGDSLNLFIEIDLSKWNSRWRELVVHKVGDVLDAMFGLPGVYTFAHEFYAACMMVVRTREDIPDDISSPHPKESDLLWYKHLGGTEGIIQKLWTIVTLAVVYLALRDLGVTWDLSGQGDNQVLKILFSSDGTRSHKIQLMEMRERILTAINQAFTKVNQEVKPEECLESTRVITYSKDVFVNGVYYPTSLKFHSRLFPQSAQDFPSVRANVGAIFSTAVAGAERTHTPLRSLHLAYFQAALYLVRILNGEGLYGERFKALLRSDRPDIIDNFVTFVLLVPSDLGGYPIATWTDFVYKGGSDPLSKSLASVVWLRQSRLGKIADKILSQLVYGDLYSTEPDILSLIKDPYSIPLDKPVTPIEGITQETLANLKPHIVTKEIKQIVDVSTEEYLDKLKRVLSTIKPFNPLIVRDILDCSVFGISDTLSRMFVATRTLQSVARTTGSSLIPKLMHLEVEGLGYLLSRYRSLNHQLWPVSTIYSLSNTLRSKWKLEDTSLPVGLTTYSPFDVPVRTGLNQLTHTGLHVVVTADLEVALTSRGRFLPYIGGKTKEKRSEHGYKIINTDTTSQAFRKLQLISSQAGGDREVRTLIDIIGLSRSNTILSDISPLLPSVYGGMLIHRYDARVGGQEAHLLGAPNFPSHCMISSDRSGPLSGGLDDYPVMFPEHYLSLLWIARELQYIDSGIFKVVRLATDEITMDVIPDARLSIAPDSMIPLLRFPGNALVFLEDIKIKSLPGSTRLDHIRIAGRGTDISIVNHRDLEMVVEAWGRSVLRGGALNRRSVDKGNELFSVEVMDIAELKSCGVGRVIHAFSNLVADEFISLAIWTQWAGVDRWRTAPAVLKLSATLASMISPIVTHPLLRSDQAVRSLKLYDRPTYTETNSLPQAILSAAIARGAIRNLEGENETYLLRTVLVTDEGNTGRPSEVFFSCLARIIRCAWKFGSLSSKEAKLLMDRQVRPAIRSKGDEKEKIERIEAAAQTIRAWSNTKHRATLTKWLSDLCGGRMVVHSCMSAREALRMTRKVEIVGNLERNLQIYTPRVNLSQTLDYYVVFSEIRTTGNQAHSTKLNQSSQDSTGTSLAIASKIARHANGRGTTGELSIIRWMWTSNLVENKRVLVVGSGLGGASTACLLGGARHVVGLDLQESMPMRPHRFIDYVPPLILEHRMEDQYTQDPLSFISSGDWYSSEVSEKFLANDSGGDAIILDIESGVDKNFMNIWRPLIRAASKGTVITRLFVDNNSLTALYGLLIAGGGRFRIAAFEGHIGLYPVCIISEGAPNIGLKPKSWAISLFPEKNILQDAPSVVLAGTSLSAAARNVMNLDDIGSPNEALLYIWWIYTTSIGEYESRLGYKKWTDILWALTGLWWITLENSTKLLWVQVCRKRGISSAQINGRLIEVHWSKGLENHILKTCASCLTLDDSRQLMDLAETQIDP